MHNSVDKIISINSEIQKEIVDKKLINYKPTIVAVSKTFPMDKISPLINFGHKHYGENKVQEALEKWPDIKNDFIDIKLHMVGKLQTNKVKYAVNIFDYIHSLDNLKLAEKISSEQLKKNKNIKIFMQVNVGNESQKSGISPENLETFFKVCTRDLGLNIIGLMCLPPNNLNEEKYFSQMLSLNKKINLSDLSMGMSNDYKIAIKYQSTFLRIGSKIFGIRD